MLPFPTEEEAKGLVGVYGIACVLAGVIIDTFLFGVFTVQFITYCYSNAHAKDRVWIRCIIAAVTAMACLLTGYNWFYISHVYVYHFGVHTTFFETRHLGWLPLIDAVTMSLTQLFFAHRAYRLCDRKLWIPICLLICILVGVSACIATRVVFGRLNSQLDSSRVQGSTIIWMAATMVGDTIITGCILYGLTRARTAIRQTRELIARLIRMTLEAQMPATMVALTLMIEVIVDPPNMLGTCIILFQSKIYVVGFFYSLNARQRLITGHQSVTMGDMGDFPVVFNERQAATIIVEQQTEMHVMHATPPNIGINRQAQTFEGAESKATVTLIDDMGSLDYKAGSSDYKSSQSSPKQPQHIETVV